MKADKRQESLLKGEKFYFTGKPCKKGHVANRRASNGFCIDCEKIKNTSDERKQYMAAYAVKNRQKIRNISSNWQKNNKGKVNANTAMRHASKMQRTPKWLSNVDKLKIKCFYQVASMYSRESEEKWHVDHIVPLQGENVSGLHVPWNLRVIRGVDNMKKNNRFYG